MQKILKKISRFFILICVINVLSINIISQELDPTVDVDVTSLNIDVRDRVTNFKQDVQNYLLKTKFTDEVIVNDVRGKPYKIKCGFQFFFKSSTGFDSYEAQVVVTAQRNIYRTQKHSLILKIKDESWAFNYTKGQTFYHDDLKFNNLTSFLDYYAYMIIGADDDSWEPSLGTQRFQKAQNVVNLAIAGSDGKGWFDNSSFKQTRNVYPTELLNSKYDNFRRAVWIYHFSGIDSIQYEKRAALEKVAQAIDMIGKVKRNEVKSFVIKAFFEAKYLEISTVLIDYYDKSIYRRLSEIDPDHAATYEEYSKK